MIVEVALSNIIIGVEELVEADVATILNANHPTAAGITDANAIAAATGATLYERLFGILDATWGLGGQTPVPKPSAYSATLATIGSTAIVEFADGATNCTIPGDAATGQVFWYCPVYNHRIGGSAYGFAARQTNLGTMAATGTTARVFFWRIA